MRQLAGRARGLIDGSVDSGFKSCLYHSLAVWSWGSWLICKRGKTIGLFTWDCCEDKEG